MSRHCRENRAFLRSRVSNSESSLAQGLAIWSLPFVGENDNMDIEEFRKVSYLFESCLSLFF